jgi:hypothetical protein
LDAKTLLVEENNMDTPLIDQVMTQLAALPPDLQWRVLEFTQSLRRSTPHGIQGRQLLRFAGTLSPDDAHQMRQEIEACCERVDVSAW